MSRNLIIAIIAGILVIGGGVAFYARQSDSDNNNSTNTQTSEQADQQESGDANFSPENTLDSDFVAIITTETDSGNIELQAEYDADSKAFRSIIKNSDQDIELIIAQDAYYSKVGDSWMKLPSSGETGTGFDKEAFEYTDQELADFQSQSSYKGEVDCPAGRCDLWEVDGDDDGTSISIYIDKQTNKFNQVVTVTPSGTSTMTYSYKDVTIEIPTDALETPGLTQ